MHRYAILPNIRHTLLCIVRPRKYNVPIYLLAVYLLYAGIRCLRASSSVSYVPRHLRQYSKPEEKHINDKILTESEAEQLKQRLTKLNMNPELLNWRQFGVVEPETPVLGVRVRRDLPRLRALLRALARVRGVRRALLVLSHAHYHADIDALVRTISFCKVMQIFYPFSVQLNPNRFPGPDPTDCADEESASDDGTCTRRNASVTETKQHWWWTANMIFYQMSWSRAHKGFVVFLAEDDYVVPDMLHMLQFARRSLAYLPEVEVVALGRPYAKSFQYDMLIVQSWEPPFDRGLAFNKSFWRKMEALSSYYCMYEDSSWSYSLWNLFSKLGNGRVEMVASAAPRVISTAMFPSGEAGESIRERLEGAQLFPARVKASLVYSSRRCVRSPGGPGSPSAHADGRWRDVRDHLLCLDPLLSTTTEPTAADDTTTPPITTSKASEDTL